MPKDRAATIAIIEGAPRNAVVEQRIRGFKKGLDAAGQKYEIVGSQPSDWTPENGQTICQNFLTSKPRLDLQRSRRHGNWLCLRDQRKRLPNETDRDQRRIEDWQCSNCIRGIGWFRLCKARAAWSADVQRKVCRSYQRGLQEAEIRYHRTSSYHHGQLGRVPSGMVNAHSKA
jgi:hypothetical protein